MSLLSHFLRYFKNSSQKKDLSASKSIFEVFAEFPHFEDKIRTWLQDNQIDANNHQNSHIIIQEYVKTTIGGVRLVQPEIQDNPDYHSEDLEKSETLTSALKN